MFYRLATNLRKLGWTLCELLPAHLSEIVFFFIIDFRTVELKPNRAV